MRTHDVVITYRPWPNRQRGWHEVATCDGVEVWNLNLLVHNRLIGDTDPTLEPLVVDWLNMAEGRA